jgi:hypothetical protein
MGLRAAGMPAVQRFGEAFYARFFDKMLQKIRIATRLPPGPAPRLAGRMGGEARSESFFRPGGRRNRLKKLIWREKIQGKWADSQGFGPPQRCGPDGRRLSAE